MIEAIAWGLGTGISMMAICNAIKGIYGKKVCVLHDKVMLAYTSDIATMKHGLMLISTYITDKAKQEERDLNKEMIDLMMGRKKEAS